MLRCLIVALIASMLCACSAPKQTFRVELTNTTSGPISAAFTKQMYRGRPAIEEGWSAPEDIAIVAPMLTDRRWGQRIDPGQMRVLGPLEGHFPTGIQPFLRVYAGDRSIDELLAVSRGDRGRIDIPLSLGSARYIIREQDGRLTVDSKGSNVR